MSDTLKLRLITEIKSELKDTPDLLLAVKAIGELIVDSGMSTEDCALLAGMELAELQDLIKKHPCIGQYFHVQRTEYKASLLKILHGHARTASDPKLALQLLALGFSEEFDSGVKKAAAKKGSGDNMDVLKKLINKVRVSAPPSPVNEAATVTTDIKESTKTTYELAHLVHE